MAWCYDGFMASDTMTISKVEYRKLKQAKSKLAKLEDWRDAMIRQGLQEAEEDIKAGRVYGPFNSVEELRRSLHGKMPKKSKREHQS